MKKKIAFLHPRLVIGGAETVLINYLNIAAKNDNYEVSLVLFESIERFNIEKIDPKVKIEFLVNSIETQFSRYCYWKTQDSNFPESEKNYYRHWDNIIDDERLERLFNYLNHNKIDVIIDFMNSTPLFLKEKHFKQISAPIIYWIHADSQLSAWVKNVEWYQKVLPYMHICVSICKDMQFRSQIALKHYLHIENMPTTMIFNPLDKSKVMELAHQAISEQDKQLIQQSFILQVARLDEQHKNHLQMIDIYHQLKQKGIKEKLYIIGEGDGRKALEQKIKSLGLEQDCLLLGSRANPFPFMKAAKVFIHTAKFEGLPTVLIESMICGTPVVAFNCPTGPREILEDGKYGELIPLDDEQLFVEKTYHLLTNDAVLQQYIALLPEAVSRFSMGNIATEFFTLINTIKTIPTNK